VEDGRPIETIQPLTVSATAVNVTRKLLFVGFENGEVRVYGYPFLDSKVILVCRLF
jgi:hypothetical protein